MSHPQDADPPVHPDDAGPAAAVDDSAAAPAEAAQRRRRPPRKRLDAQREAEHDAGSAATAGAGAGEGAANAESTDAAGSADAAISADGFAEPHAAGATGDGRPDDEAASRRTRRNRRRGRKGRALREDGAEGITQGSTQGMTQGNDQGIATAYAAPPAPLVMPDASELFATVTSGAFDSEALLESSVDVDLDALQAPGGSAAAATVTGEAAGAQPDAALAAAAPPEDSATALDPSRRVLLPDAEAPKLQKVLAQAGVGSRRDLEQMILDKRVTVNGEPAHTGQRVSWGDRVAVDGKPVRVRIAPLPARVIAYHKPAGEVVSHDDPQQRPTVFRRLPRLPHGKWQSVGRLDINTEGLLLFTTSGELANQLMHPRFGVEREYAVRVLGTVDSEARARLLEGVQIEGQTAAFKSLEDGGGEGVNHWYRVVITEGRNREVRRLFEAVGLTVSRLIRIRYGSVVLPRGLKRGVCVDLAEDDVKLLRRLTGLSNPGEGQRGSRNNRRGPRNDAGPGAPMAGPGEQRAERGPRKGPRQEPRQESRREPRPQAMPREPRRAPPERGPRHGQPAQPSHANQTHGGRQRPQAAFGDAAVHAHEFDERDHVEVVEVSHIPNPLQQTFDQRAIREARNARRELSDDAPIPNPLQQTYDKRALKENREPHRDVGDDDGPIPNPLQQTYDKRFAQGGGGGGGGGGGPRGRNNGAGGGAGGRRKAGGGGGAGGKSPGGQPDPMKTAVGYIGGDAFLRKKTGGRGGKGGGGGPGGPGGGNRRGGRGGPAGSGNQGR